MRRRIAHGNAALDDERLDGWTLRRIQLGGNLVGHRAWADEQQIQIGIGAARSQSAVNHDGGGVIPAEEVDGDP